MSTSNLRGLFIVLEGVNGCSKTTTINEILKYKMKYKNIKVYKFPDRSGYLGDEINKFLTNTKEMQSTYDKLDLFAKNRKYYINEMLELLHNGTTILCDRYVYSAIAYQLPTDRLVSEYGISSMTYIVSYFDKNMIKPDIVFLLDGHYLEKRQSEKERYHYQTDINKKIFEHFKKVLLYSNVYFYIIETKLDDKEYASNSIMDIIDNNYEYYSKMPITLIF